VFRAAPVLVIEGFKGSIADILAEERIEAIKVCDVEEAIIQASKDERIKLIIFDATTMGFNFCKQLSGSIRTKILIIVPAYSIAWKALELGYDEVIVKPFNHHELVLRVRKLLQVGELHIGELTIDLKARRVMRGEEEVRLTALEYDLLAYLAQNAGRVVSYDELLNSVWGYDYDRGTHWQVKTAIKRLRRKIENDSANPNYIVNVRRAGYMLRE
jgi:DNA-binding response OmpR family regulator